MEQELIPVFQVRFVVLNHVFGVVFTFLLFCTFFFAHCIVPSSWSYRNKAPGLPLWHLQHFLRDFRFKSFCYFYDSYFRFEILTCKFNTCWVWDYICFSPINTLRIKDNLSNGWSLNSMLPLCAATSMNSDGVKFVFWARISPLNEMMLLCKCCPHLSKMTTFTYNRANNIVVKKLSFWTLSIIYLIFVTHKLSYPYYQLYQREPRASTIN